MSLPESWEKVRVACALLHELASVQAERGLHPLAPQACEWLEHVGSVAAWERGPALRGKGPAQPCPEVLQ